MPERSLLAGAAEPVLRLRGGRKKFIDPEACAEYISGMARAGAVRYVLPRAVKLSGRITESDSCGMQCFTISPKAGSACCKRIVYLHGGSYFSPPHILHWDMLLHLGDLCGAEVVLPIYPRAPLRTCSAAYEALEEYVGSYAPDVLMGDSAGGGLALGLAQILGDRAPQKVILLSPWLDIALENPRIADYEPLDAVLGSYGLRRLGKVWAGALDPHDPRVSPIYGDMSRLKDITILAGTHELFYPDAEKLSDILTEQNIEHRLIVGEGMSHVWVSYPMKEGREALSRIAEIIGE